MGGGPSAPSLECMEKKRQKKKSVVSAVLDDGALVEAIYREDVHKTSFLVWRDGVCDEVQSLEVPFLGTLVPYSPSNNLIAHRVLLLPSGASEYGTDQELVATVRRFINRFADLSEGFEEVASHFVLMTWVYDTFNEVPYLRLKGDFGTGKSRCLQTIGSLCYKPMFASGASTTSPLFRIIDAFRGTLVIDESDFWLSDERAEIIKILNNGNAVGFPVLRSEATPSKEFNPTAFNVFGPKIIATRRAFSDDALESRCITEALSGLPPRRDIPLTLPPTFAQEATAIRNQLLMYRFRRHGEVGPSASERDPGVEARVAQVVAPLLAVAQDERTEERLRAIARGSSSAMAAQRSATVEAQLLDIMLDMRRDGISLQVKEIASRFNQRFAADYPNPVTPRWVGAQLRGRLSIVPVKRHGTFVVPEAQEARLWTLCQRYGLRDVKGGHGDVGDVAGADLSS